MRILLLGMTLMLAACSHGGGDDENLGVASGNSLTSTQIDAALGPANQQQFSANEMNGTTNATETGGGVGERARAEQGQEPHTTQLNAATRTPSR